MSTKYFRLFAANPLNINCQQTRYYMRGKPPTEALTLKQRLDLIKKQNETLPPVNIGLAVPKIAKKDVLHTWFSGNNVTRSAKEQMSRTKTLLIDIQKTNKIWMNTTGPSDIHKIANHYGIFNDLYGNAYFNPVLPLEIEYNLKEDDLIAKVYRGNVIKPDEACNQPNVTYEANSDSLWSLILTTPDGNMHNSENEYCHWFIGNIPGNNINKGEEIIDYLRPIPQRGIGYCRYIFVLYKQDQYIDYKEYKRTKPCRNLIERDWKTLDFYRKHQNILTPVGLAFFQADWDSSLTDFYHTELNMREPVFQYDFPKPYIKPQVWFPKRLPFNIYLDKYRDQKEINKEFLLEKLKKVHPFKGPEPKLKYPNAHLLSRDVPTWLQVEIKKKRLGWGRINEIE